MSMEGCADAQSFLILIFFHRKVNKVFAVSLKNLKFGGIWVYLDSNIT